MDGRKTGVDGDSASGTGRAACLSSDIMAAIVESERRRLSKADAILTSLCIALDHADSVEADGTLFSLVAESARDLIAASVESLDSVRLAQLQTSAEISQATTMVMRHETE